MHIIIFCYFHVIASAIIILQFYMLEHSATKHCIIRVATAMSLLLIILGGLYVYANTSPGTYSITSAASLPLSIPLITADEQPTSY